MVGYPTYWVFELKKKIQNKIGIDNNLIGAVKIGILNFLIFKIKKNRDWYVL